MDMASEWMSFVVKICRLTICIPFGISIMKRMTSSSDVKTMECPGIMLRMRWFTYSVNGFSCVSSSDATLVSTHRVISLHWSFTDSSPTKYVTAGARSSTRSYGRSRFAKTPRFVDPDVCSVAGWHRMSGEQYPCSGVSVPNGCSPRPKARTAPLLPTAVTATGADDVRPARAPLTSAPQAFRAAADPCRRTTLRIATKLER
mmetsp:Transcript_28656/g.88805  ORF Transcript_28656/g.88805 Transcript_28656/m.88805 type:complete len:202 (-) Transcript_28656:31-636(-)